MSFNYKRSLTSIICALIVFILVSCTNTPLDIRSSKAAVYISASENLNPDIKGRPSPIVFYIYQLKSDDGFNNAPFFEIYDNAESVLGTDKIDVMEYELSPNDELEIDKFVLDDDTQYIGFFAAYRDINASIWRVSKPVRAHRTSHFSVFLGRSEMRVENGKR